MDRPDLAERTKVFALRIIRLYQSLPKTGAGQVIGHQLLRCGTSVGAQYRESHRGRSTAEFVSKLQCVVQELDETAYWLELLAESKTVAFERVQALRNETDELLAIFTTSVKTARRRER